jgi:hypothetical protein
MAVVILTERMSFAKAASGSSILSCVRMIPSGSASSDTAIDWVDLEKAAGWSSRIWLISVQFVLALN